MCYTAYDLVGLHLPHTTLCLIDFSSHTLDGSQRGQIMGIKRPWYTEDSLESLLSVSKNLAALCSPQKLPLLT